MRHDDLVVTRACTDVDYVPYFSDRSGATQTKFGLISTDC